MSKFPQFWKVLIVLCLVGRVFQKSHCKLGEVWHLGGPSAKVGSSAKLGVPVFKASLLDYPGGPSAKVCSSAKYEHTSSITSK